MQMSNMLTGLLVVFFIVTCVALILVVLIQRPQGGGLSGAFGGGSGSGQTAFGAKVGDVLTYATITIFVLFLLTAIGLTYAIRPADATQQTSLVGSGEPQETGETEGLPAGEGVPVEDVTADERPADPGDVPADPEEGEEEPPAGESNADPADEGAGETPPAGEGDDGANGPG